MFSMSTISEQSKKHKVDEAKNPFVERQCCEMGDAEEKETNS